MSELVSGRVASPPGSHPSDQTPSGSGAVRFDPSRLSGFRTIVADPPWTPALHRNTVGRREGPYRAGPQRYYQTLGVEQIVAMAPETAPQAHLWLWVLNQHVDWGYRVARAWGFEPQQMITWRKPGLGLGRFQCNSESVLVCRKGGATGNPFGFTRGTCFDWPRGIHSEKPAEFFALVEAASPPPYVEMFARKRRAGWASVGDQLEPPTITHVRGRPKVFCDSCEGLGSILHSRSWHECLQCGGRGIYSLRTAQGIVTEGGDANAAPVPQGLEPGPAKQDAPNAPPGNQLEE